MARSEQAIFTNLCMIYDHNGNILVQDRLDPDWPGLCFPGGHVEPGESVVSSVIREMKEETGLTVHAPKLCGIKQFPINGGRYLVFFFKASSFEGQLCSSEEGNVEWIRRCDLPNMNTVTDFMQMLRIFDDDSLTEFQYIVDGEDWKVCLK